MGDPFDPSGVGTGVFSEFGRSGSVMKNSLPLVVLSIVPQSCIAAFRLWRGYLLAVASSSSFGSSTSAVASTSETAPCGHASTHKPQPMQ